MSAVIARFATITIFNNGKSINSNKMDFTIEQQASNLIQQLIQAVRELKESKEKKSTNKKRPRHEISTSSSSNIQPQPTTSSLSSNNNNNNKPTIPSFHSKSLMVNKLIHATRNHPQYSKLYIEQLANLEPLQKNDNSNDDDELITKTTILSQPLYHILALDCEMVQTTMDNMALARVSVVEIHDFPQNITPVVMLDRLVRPRFIPDKDFVTDTRFSITGLTPDELFISNSSNRHNNALSWESARVLVRNLLMPNNNTILVGHALHHDLLALGFSIDDKKSMIIDTSLLFEVDNCEAAEITHGLQYLCRIVLTPATTTTSTTTNSTSSSVMERTERGGTHDSIEDAKAALEIVQTLYWHHPIHNFQFHFPDE
jgi:hypothetical protein